MKLRAMAASTLLLACASVAMPQENLPAETRNAALRYWMAFAEIKDPQPDKALQELLEKTATGEASWDERELGPTLDVNDQAIRIMQRATKLPDCDWGIEYSQGPRARVLARLNTLEGIREMKKGHVQVAVEVWLAGIRFSRDMAQGATLMPTMTAKESLLSNLKALTREVEGTRLNNAQ